MLATDWRPVLRRAGGSSSCAEGVTAPAELADLAGAAKAHGTASSRLQWGFRPPPGLAEPRCPSLPFDMWSRSTDSLLPPGALVADMPPGLSLPEASDAASHELARPPSHCLPKGGSEDETQVGSGSSHADDLKCEGTPSWPSRLARGTAMGVEAEATGAEVRGNAQRRYQTQRKKAQRQVKKKKLRLGEALTDAVEPSPGLCALSDSEGVPLRQAAGRVLAQVPDGDKVLAEGTCFSPAPARDLRPEARPAADRPQGPLDCKWVDECGAVGSIVGSAMR